jgi:hypothetical protein
MWRPILMRIVLRMSHPAMGLLGLQEWVNGLQGIENIVPRD